MSGQEGARGLMNSSMRPRFPLIRKSWASQFTIARVGSAHGAGQDRREIVMSRVIDAPRDLVFEAWPDPKHLPQMVPKDQTTDAQLRIGECSGFHNARL